MRLRSKLLFMFRIHFFSSLNQSNHVWILVQFRERVKQREESEMSDNCIAKVIYRYILEDRYTCLRSSSPTIPACSTVKLSESGETIITVSSEYWVSRIDMSCVTRTKTSWTLSFGVPSSIGGGLIFGERLSEA